MTDLTQQVADLTPEAKRALLADLLRQQMAAGSESPPTHGQQAMWYLHQQAPESSAYNVAFAFRVCSAIDVPALRRSIQALVDRHAPLRTTFSTREGKPVQVVHTTYETDLATIDAAQWDDEALDSAVRAAYHRPFDLESGPILRATLFTRSSGDHILLVIAHHIAVDAWSLSVLLGELRVLYPAERTGHPASLPPLAVQYPDYARWQNQLVRGPEGDRQWGYWQRQLAGELPSLALPTDHPRPPVQTFKGGTLEFALDGELSDRIRAFARGERSTVFSVLQAAFQVLLHRYTGQDDILVGSPVAGRSRPEFAGLVGDFINMVVLRANFTGAPTFRVFLTQVRDTVLGALDNQDFPFALLVERLAPKPDPSRSPIFQAVFNLRGVQNTSALADLALPGRSDVTVDLGGLALKPYPLHQQEGQLDLAMLIVDSSETFQGYLQYRSDLFDRATIERMAGHYRRILEAVVADPDQTVDSLPLLDADERHRILTEWNTTEELYPVNLGLHQLIEMQCDRSPVAPAVGHGPDQLSYAALDRSANQLAQHLRKQGIGRGSIVGICLERTSQLLVALLGILKSGAAYLPLDPSYPAERLSYMIADSNAAALLTTEELASTLPPDGPQILCLDGLASQLLDETDCRPAATHNSTDIAYLIYTSGSTGKPKGVAIPHRAVVNFLSTMGRRPGLSSDDVLVAITTLAFDIAVLELFLPLTVGARVVLADRDTARNGQALLGLLRTSGATVLQGTPMTFRLLLQGGLREAQGLRCLCGGEPLPSDLAHDLLEAGCELWNMYGPTETTVWSTTHNVVHADTAIPVGRPIGNTRVYILDSALQPLPPGVVGELYIGGDGVACGYHHRADLTTERFVPDPFAADAAARMYRTGDLARYRPEGTIVVLGRTDHQVKLRGFRIELAEIESALRLLAAVHEAVVVLREDRQGEQRLVAYLAHGDDTPPGPGELRGALRRRLPDYMVPSAFVPLPDLPRTPNGKIDRQRLPVPVGIQTSATTTFVDPATDAEREIAAAWCAVLGLPRVSALDNFFDLGGHSLQAMEAIASIEQRIGVRPNPALLQTQTLGQLAASCDNLPSKPTVNATRSTPLLSAKVLSAMRRMIGSDKKEVR